MDPALGIFVLSSAAEYLRSQERSNPLLKQMIRRSPEAWAIKCMARDYARRRWLDGKKYKSTSTGEEAADNRQS